MDKPTNSWPLTANAHSLLFVAQTIKQLTSIEEFESFRMMTLDTMSRINEAKILVQDIQRGLSKQSFSPVAKELCWSLRSDPVVDHKNHDQISNALKFFDTLSINDSTDMARIYSKLDVLSAKISSSYKNRLEEYIVNNYRIAANRAQTLLAVSFYLSHLINNNYSRQYISDTADEVFFLEDIGRATSVKLREFFDKFDLKDSKYDVYFQIDDLAVSYLKDVYNLVVVEESAIPPAVIAAYVMSGLSIDINMNFACVRKKAKDMFSAARQTYDEITSITSVSILSAWDFSISRPTQFCSFMSRRKIARAYSINVIDGGSSIKIAKSQARGIRESKADNNNIQNYFDERSIERINNSISTVYSALESNTYDSRLISIWSSFEALLSSPSSRSVRILHYIEIVSPCIVSSYPERCILIVYNMLILTNRVTLISLLDEIATDVGENRYLQFVSMLYNDKYMDKFLALKKGIKSYPLLLYRLESLKEKFSNPDKYVNAIALHKERVDWQLSRIYRARNQLVHAGRAPAYLEALTINAFEYYRNAVRNILVHAKGLGEQNDVDTVVESIGLNHSGHISFVNGLKSCKKFTTETLPLVFLLNER